MNLHGSTALVIGGAVRIGRAICRALAARGCQVAIHCRWSRSEAEYLEQAIRTDGGTAFVVQGDLSSQGNCRRIVAETWEKAGGFNILVNNAAVFHKDTLETASADDLMAEMTVNFLAPALLTMEFARRVMEVVGAVGRVVNLLDRRIAGVEADCLSYQASKKMLAAFTQAAALELAPRVIVNGVAPGPALAPTPAPVNAAGRTRERAGAVPLGRRNTPEEIAEAVMFLLESDGIAGQILFVDGGQHLLGPNR
ncbi:MAG: SDR family oxidoreductase [Verrucomicrobiota bacterium]|nr:SDR family oxidoreductase [Verrucomicrobiota bacterium]